MKSAAGVMSHLRKLIVGVCALIPLLVCVVSGQEPFARDTLARGVYYSRYELPGPVVANVVTVDLRDSTVNIVAFQLPGLVRTSEQAKALADSGNVVLAAVNADFFSFETGWPVGNTAIDGTLVLGVRSLRSHLIISGGARPYIERLRFIGAVITSRGDAVTLGGVNNPTPTDQSRLYTPSFGASTNADSLGVKVLLRRLGTAGTIHDTAWYVVTGRVIRGPATIPSAGGVLSIPDEVLLRTSGGFFAGDTLAIVTDFVPSPPEVRQVVGGAGRILINGRCDTLENHSREDLSLKFQSDLHPRTFIGFDRDTTILFMCTVDGRQDKSRGVNFPEMADFLRSVGAWNAINLDGGGSTTMVIRGKVVNSPSDKTGERPVANILAVVLRSSKGGM